MILIFFSLFIFHYFLFEIYLKIEKNGWNSKYKLLGLHNLDTIGVFEMDELVYAFNNAI